MKAIYQVPIEEKDLEQLIQKPILSRDPYGSPLGRYLVDHFARNTQFKVDIYTKFPFSHELLTQLTIALTRRCDQNTKRTKDFHLSNYFVPETR